MSTRFYFAPADAPSIAPAISSAWEQSGPTGGYQKGTLKPAPEGAALIGGSGGVGTKSSATTPWDMISGQFISRPLPTAGTLSGTFDLVVQVLESIAAADMMLQCVIRVVDGPGTTVRGTAYAGQTNTTVVTTAGAQNQEFSLSPAQETRWWSAIALSNVNYSAGDRIVVEIGARSVNAAATGAGNVYVWDATNVGPIDSRGDLVKGNATPIASYSSVWGAPRSWIEFSQDLYPTLTAEQYRFMDDGITLNTSPSLPFVDITSVEGLDSTDVRLQTHDREGLHGGYAASQFETLRTVTLEGIVYADPLNMEAYLDSLKANFAPSTVDKKLYFGTDTGMRFVWGKSQGFKYAKDNQRGRGVVNFQVQIVCQDPRIYSPTEITTSANATDAVTNAYTVVNNPGNRDTFSRFNIFGPAETGMLIILQSGLGRMQLQYNGALAAGDLLTVDTERRTVMLNYFTNVRGNLGAFTTGTLWLPLQPGDNRFQCQRGGATVFSYQHTFRPAWR